MTQVLCSISTRGRYRTTLPLALSAAINQTRKPDKIIVYDDNDSPEDLRDDSTYRALFTIMDRRTIAWEWVFAQKKGQHYNHQMANVAGYEWVWRVDDDTIPEPNVLSNLLEHIAPDVAGVGGAVFTPHWDISQGCTGKIEDIDKESNIQWGPIFSVTEVDHLHCTFLYRAGIHDYNLGLSRVAHREETLFTWGLRQKGYKLLVVPDTLTWHLKSEQGGIRNESQAEMFWHDDQIFRNHLKYKDQKVVVLDCGMGDHIVMKHVLPKLKDPVTFTCYPEIVPGGSIAEAYHLFGDLMQWNVYHKMNLWKWTNSLEEAYCKLYGVPYR